MSKAEIGTMRKDKSGHRTRRGIALISALMIVAVLMILVGAMLSFLPRELLAVGNSSFDNRALYAADAGVEAAVVSIEEQSPAWAAGIPSYNYPAEPNGAHASYQVTINDARSIDALHTYYVTSTGTAPYGQQRKVDAIIQEQSFSFYDYFEKNATPGGWWISGLTQLNGPVYLEGHSNPENFYYIDNRPSIGLDTMTVSGQYDWWGGAAPSSVPDWTSLDAKGQPAVGFKPSDYVQWPADMASMLVANEAFSGTVGSGAWPAPSQGKGVYINQNEISTFTHGGSAAVSTGIFVQGDANITTSATSTTNTFSFTPTGSGSGIPKAVTVTVDFSANTTTVSEGGTTATFTGVPSGEPMSGSGPNGAVFVNGNVFGLTGTVHGAYTIAVPDTTGLANDIHLAGNIMMENDPQTCGCASTDELGIYAHNIYLDNGAPNNITVEGALFAGNINDVNTNDGQGTFTANFNIFGHPAAGYLNVFGSMVQHVGGSFGAFGGGCGCMVSGYNDSYHYDSRYATAPPPFYPRTGLYKIIAWTDKGS
jgi:hypothetical protein